jgi:hypothetical protein
MVIGMRVRFYYGDNKNILYCRVVQSVQRDSVTFRASPHNNAQQTFELSLMNILSVALDNG